MGIVRFAVVAWLASLGAWGCQPAPDEVCEKFMSKLASFDQTSGLSDTARDEASEVCLEVVSAIEADGGDGYTCTVECVDGAKSAGALLQCPLGCQEHMQQKSKASMFTTGDLAVDIEVLNLK